MKFEIGDTAILRTTKNDMAVILDCLISSRNRTGTIREMMYEYSIIWKIRGKKRRKFDIFHIVDENTVLLARIVLTEKVVKEFEIINNGWWEDQPE